MPMHSAFAQLDFACNVPCKTVKQSGQCFMSCRAAVTLYPAPPAFHGARTQPGWACPPAPSAAGASATGAAAAAAGASAAGPATTAAGAPAVAAGATRSSTPTSSRPPRRYCRSGRWSSSSVMKRICPCRAGQQGLGDGIQSGAAISSCFESLQRMPPAPLGGSPVHIAM